MTICVYGMGHSGIVVSACLAAEQGGVVGYQPDPALIAGLNDSTPPFYEDGLVSLITSGLMRGSLRFTADPKDAFTGADVVIVALDTPIRLDGNGDPQSVFNSVLWHLQFVDPGAMVVIMSQVPVGFTRSLADAVEYSAPSITWAIYPENMRTGHAVDDWRHQARGVIGAGVGNHKRVEEIFSPFSSHFIPTDFESAEMSKHAINAWLALSITYANELGALCKATEADWMDVEAALRSDNRVGMEAYVHAGLPFGGGHLGRDVNYLLDMAENNCITAPVIDAIFRSNLAHGVRLAQKRQQS